MDALSRQVAERLVHNALAGDTVHSGKTRPFDGQAEMRLAAAVVAHMAMMARAVVTEGEIRVGKGCGEQAFHLLLHGAFVAHGVDHKLRSEEHTSELQSLMRISYAVFCLKKKKDN